VLAVASALRARVVRLLEGCMFKRHRSERLWRVLRHPPEAVGSRRGDGAPAAVRQAKLSRGRRVSTDSANTKVLNASQPIALTIRSTNSVQRAVSAMRSLCCMTR